MSNFIKTLRSLALLLCITSLNLAVAQQNVLDKVIAVVGNEAILESDMEQEIMQLRAQGQMVDDNLRCEIFENLLVQKLLLAQAKIDSLAVNDVAVEQEVEQRLRYFTMQLGSAQKVEEYWHKPMFEIKEQMRKMVNDNNLTQQMRMKIVEGVVITPRDVELFYKSMPTDSFPMIPEQFVIQQIAKYPPSGSEARYLVREKLLELRERAMKGEKFSTLAVMYSEDGSARRGGELGLSPREQFVKPFADAGWSLKQGQVSQIVETEFGYHIIQCIEIQGDMRNLRHILIRPKFSSETQQRATQQLDSVAQLIRADSMTFESAVTNFSEDKSTRMSGGHVINQETQTTRFDKDQLVPTDYKVLRDMKVGEVSLPFASQDASGNEIFKVIKLKELIPVHRANLVQDYMVIHDDAQNRKQQETFESWVQKRIKTAIIIINPEMHSCKMQRSWVK
ncbi:MAG: peptidylprolyl isomerase [Prevotellaceae bacterium]|jgi:peptidyl-prolyl cis-trans isomerase SurA|nr:peptidylprolyl isomerase [Prevotellaceae bacterium]